jgi:hypothetical protein
LLDKSGADINSYSSTIIFVSLCASKKNHNAINGVSLNEPPGLLGPVQNSNPAAIFAKYLAGNLISNPN